MLQEFGRVSCAVCGSARCSWLGWSHFFTSPIDESFIKVSRMDVRGKRSRQESQLEDSSLVFSHATVFPLVPTPTLFVPECFAKFTRPVAYCHT